MTKRWQYVLGVFGTLLLLASAHPAAQRQVDHWEQETEESASEEDRAVPEDEEVVPDDEDVAALEQSSEDSDDGQQTASAPSGAAFPGAAAASTPPYILDLPPNRPSWFGISREPTESERLAYQERMQRYQAIDVRSSTEPVRSSRVRARILEMRDRIVRSPEVPGAWRWSRVRDIVAEFGTQKRPIVRDTSGRQSEDSFMFTMLNEHYLGVNERAVLSQGDRDVEGAMVHEATHIALEEEYERYSGFGGKEHAFLVDGCHDVARLQLLATEMLAFFNQTLYISATSPTAPLLDVGDSRLVAVLLGYQGSESARRHFMAYIETYVAIEMRRVPPGRCGLPTAVQGSYQGQYVLFYDLAQAEIGPFFAYGSARP